MQCVAPFKKWALCVKLNNNNGNMWMAVHLVSAEEAVGTLVALQLGSGFWCT